MDKVYSDFFKTLLDNSNHLSAYVDSLYAGNDYSESDLNQIFGVLNREGLIACSYMDNRAWVREITFAGKHFFDNNKEHRLTELINQIDVVESKFHASGFGDAVRSVIYDVQEFQDWLQEVNLELREIHDRTGDHYIWETLTLFNEKLNGRNDKRFFSELKGRLKAIGKNIEKYYPADDTSGLAVVDKEDILMTRRMPKIFISHSSKDKDYVAQIVNLLDGMGLNQTQVFCSSLPGYGIPIDTNIFEYLRDQFLQYDLHVIFIHSENYYKSAISLNEMGAAWALKASVTSILLPGFEFEQMVGVVNNQSIAIKLSDKDMDLQDKLNQLYDKIVQEFGLTRKADIIWQQKRDAFIAAVRG